ncbi:unnamed protein product [Cladocopium goreaui]|uniref:Exonuclease mut-7 homolog (Exonuclease 3'-5 ' domain-containing protein 3 homolog) n=1 Tax=Cladocopium goreaui TaxID=2562237 RepID=A0A9P1C2F1_9DINO|nr:unnamed protein product [Cladocopium goreaui]
MQLLDLPDEDARKATKEWLASLDKNPTELLANLHAQSGVRRLGFYAAALTQFWLEHGPVWDTKRSLSAVQLSAGGRSRQTAGQLKLVCLRPGEALHVESSVKFFADASSEVPQMPACTSSYVGPFLHENLAWRLAEARRKVTCTESASVQEFLRKELGEVQIRSVYLLKGFIFQPLDDFLTSRRLCNPPAELNPECSTGWYATNIKEAVAKMVPGARMAVLPKLFWLSPVVASGEPPQIWGEELPGQQEAVATDWPQKIQEDVEEHFTRVHTALLLCELVPVGNGWMENSRGFILPPVWDPRSLMTGKPQGMKSSAEADASLANSQEPSKWSNQRRRYSERLADTARKQGPSLADAGVHVAVPQRLEEELTVDHLVNYVLASTRTKKGTDPQRIQRKRSLHTAMCDREALEKGKASCLVAESLQRLAEEKYRTDGHFILELMVKPSEVGYAPADCSVTFEADGASVRKILDLGLAGDICLRLAVKFALRFCFPADPVSLKDLPPLIKDHLADRARLAGLVEYLALCNSLTLLKAQAEPREGDAPRDVDTMDTVDTVDLNRILQKLTLPPADAAVLELLCQHCTDFCEPVSSMLLASGQLKLAKKIERLKHGWKPALSPLDSPGATPSTFLTPLTLPPEVEVVLVSDAATLESACRRAKQGGVVGLDAEWKPEERRRDGRQDRQDVVNPVQLLQLAWTDVVYLLDIPLLRMEPKLLELCDELCGDRCVLVGFGLEGDLRRLADSYPQLLSAWSSASFYHIDMSDLSPREVTSLDGFCAFCLGQALDKTQQCSRWDLRPFSDQQLNYAALDAWILLALLGHISKGAPFEQLHQLAAFSVTDALKFARRGCAGLDRGVCAVAAMLKLLGAESALCRSSDCPGDVAVCKTVACTVFSASGEPSFCMVVMADGDGTVSLERLAAAVNCTSARLTSSEELREEIRQPRGSVGPVGPVLKSASARIVLDDSLMGSKVLSCGAGTSGWQLLVTPNQLQEWTPCIVSAIKEID